MVEVIVVDPTRTCTEGPYSLLDHKTRKTAHSHRTMPTTNMAYAILFKDSTPENLQAVLDHC